MFPLSTPDHCVCHREQDRVSPALIQNCPGSWCHFWHVTMTSPCTLSPATYEEFIFQVRESGKPIGGSAHHLALQRGNRGSCVDFRVSVAQYAWGEGRNENWGPLFPSTGAPSSQAPAWEGTQTRAPHPCLPAPGAPGVNPSPLHSAQSPTHREAIDAAPAAAIVPMAGAAAAPFPLWPGKDPPPRLGLPWELSCTPTCTQEKGSGQVWTQLLSAGREEGMGSPGWWGLNVGVRQTWNQSDKETLTEKKKE